MPRARDDIALTAEGVFSWLEKIQQHSEFIALKLMLSMPSTYCGRMAFVILTSPFCSPKTRAPKTSRWQRAPKRRKEQRPESRPEPWSEELWVGSQALARWLSRGWAPSSRQVRL